MQSYLSDTTVWTILRELDMQHLVEAIVDCDNSTTTQGRRFFLCMLVADGTNDLMEEKLSCRVLTLLREKGFREGEMVTARRLPFNEAPISNTGP